MMEGETEEVQDSQVWDLRFKRMNTCFESTRGQGEEKAGICKNCGKHFDQHEEVQDSEVSRRMECDN